MESLLFSYSMVSLIQLTAGSCKPKTKLQLSDWSKLVMMFGLAIKEVLNIASTLDMRYSIQRKTRIIGALVLLRWEIMMQSLRLILSEISLVRIRSLG